MCYKSCIFNHSACLISACPLNATTIQLIEIILSKSKQMILEKVLFSFKRSVLSCLHTFFFYFYKQTWSFYFHVSKISHCSTKAFLCNYETEAKTIAPVP